MNTVTLHSAATKDVTLRWALREAAPAGGVALLATARRYQVGLVDDARELKSRSGTIAPDDVFEARVFTPTSELRWLHIADGKGRAVVLSENDAAIPNQFGEQLAPINAVDTCTGGYLLWGRVARSAGDGWTTLATERIGTLSIPADITGDHARLATCEYIAVEPVHGNAYIAEERLLHFETIAPSRPKDS
ncbi:type III-D CRISPR-associated protein Csx19 [Actinomadura napierensis]|uniref:TIGR03984 family CRISPR-associated protein n=1 Tax=Actinomadura napierensis TaxID=267854 RepID=A0ABP5M3J8_9ACTN